MAQPAAVRPRKRAFHTGLMVVLLGVFVLADGQKTQAEQSRSRIDRTTALVVMINGRLGELDTFGAGILVGRRDGRIYVATANHVVRQGADSARSIRIRFKLLPEEAFPATLLPQVNPELDLALLSIEESEARSNDFCSLPVDGLGDANAVKRGDPVYPVGNPGGANWGMPVQPEPVARIEGDRVLFQSQFIGVGHTPKEACSG